MTDSEMYGMLLVLYEQIRDQQVVANESVLVGNALKRAIDTTNPAFDDAYDTCYKALLAGPIGTVQAQKIDELDKLIEALQKLTPKV